MAHKISNYLLGGISIDGSIRFWCAESPTSRGKGFPYLAEILDWVSRAVPTWQSTLGRSSVSRCQYRANFPHLCRSKFPWRPVDWLAVISAGCRDERACAAAIDGLMSTFDREMVVVRSACCRSRSLILRPR